MLLDGVTSMNNPPSNSNTTTAVMTTNNNNNQQYNNNSQQPNNNNNQQPNNNNNQQSNNWANTLQISNSGSQTLSYLDALKAAVIAASLSTDTFHNTVCSPLFYF